MDIKKKRIKFAGRADFIQIRFFHYLFYMLLDFYSFLSIPLLPDSLCKHMLSSILL